MLLFQFQSKSYACQSEQQIRTILCQMGVSQSNMFFQCNSKLLNLNEVKVLPKYSTVRGLLKLRGGKGGFGAKLKTEGGKKVRPNDNMFSRDISGRRIAYIMVEKDYADFCRKKDDEDRKVKKERQDFKLMENTLKQQHAFMKLDKAYNNYMCETQRNLQQSFSIGKAIYFNNNRSNCQEQKEEKLLQQKKQQKNEQKLLKKDEDGQCDNLRSFPEKKVKVDVVMSSAKDKLKSLFKK